MPSLLPDDLFSSSRLTSLAAVEEALSEFEVATQVNFQQPDLLIIQLLQDYELALPLVLSSIDDSAFNPLRAHIFSFFHAGYKKFAESVSPHLLTKLSHFLYFYDAPSSFLQIEELVRSNYNTAQGSLRLLELLSTMDFAGEELAPDEEEDFGFRVRNRKQKAKKHVRTKSKAVDPKPFKNLGVQVPSSRIEAEKLTNQLLQSLESILEFYLSSLRNANFSNAIKLSSITSVIEPLVTNEIVAQEPARKEATFTEEIPGAFPKVQPMKSAFHFDSIEGFGEWSIFISQNADAELRNRHRKDQHSFDIIVKKIKELSNGHFSADNQKRLSGPNSEVPVFEAKMSADLRLIYQIDIVANDDGRAMQAIKIFGIYTHAQMDDRMWQSISMQLGRKGEEYRDRCAFRKPAENADGQTFVPALFPPLPEIPEDDSTNWLAEDDPVLSRFLMDKYVVLSQPLLNTMLADLDATFPHLVSAKEKEIIEHPYSSYVIGRSGTGKTTTLLFKMLLVERSHQLMTGDVPKPRQIFVTQSRILAKKVEQYFETLGRSLTATSFSVEQLCEHRLRQSDAVLDEDGDMIDADDILDWSGDLPAKFSELRDEHFPLFTTFNGLCALLEADITEAVSTPTSKKSLSKVTVTTNPSQRGSVSVTYDVFLRDYWPHFPQSLTSKLDSSLVFSELIGVIKGSEETLEGAKHTLERDTYHNLSARTQSTFAENRGDLYDLFNSYVSKKKRLGDVDSADRAHRILDFFKSRGIPGQKIDNLYVDEVQDNLLIDTLILRMLCHDDNGLFWAGDTAQTIAVGSSFRFDSLKAFQWRLEQKRRSKSLSSRHAIEPETFQLSVNYRSHSGIVDCAHSVIELITRFWKDSIDRLAPEKGVVAGLKPLFFLGWDEDTSGLDQFVFGDSGNRIEFGAQQCILVRNEAAREQLKEKLGEGVGLIMTIYDSKGLEFNDVLLYDFFGDSPAKLAQWRLILSALSDHSRVAAPDFDRNRQRYSGICTELKFLYVAITRARENVWIVDSSENSEPMRMYWSEREVIRVIKPGAKLPKLATSSTPEEWAYQGHHLFQRKKWGEAKHCFERALQPEKAAIAEAYLMREKAERSSFDTKDLVKERKKRFVGAAQAFTKCAQSAGRKRTLDFMRIAGHCYQEGHEFLLAAESYRTARQFDDSIRCYRKAERYDEAVEIVQSEKDVVDPSLAADVIRVAKMFYFNQVQSLPSSTDRNRRLQQAEALFDSLDDQLVYLEDRDMDVARAALLVAHGRAREAAELHLEGGRTLEAIDFFIQDTGSEESTRRAMESVLDGLRRKLTFAVSPGDLVTDTGLFQLFGFAKRINQLSLTPDVRNELALFQAIMEKDLLKLKDLGHVFFSANKRPAALLSLDHYYNSSLPFDNLSVYQMAEAQDTFRLYLKLLLDVCTHRRPVDQPGLSRLFGFQKLSDSHVLLLTGSYLHQQFSTQDQDQQIDTLEFQRHFQTWISNRLRDRVSAQTSICRSSSSFTPCLTYAVFEYCHREASCQDAHIPSASLTESFYNARLRVHFQQILIVWILHRSNPFSSPQMALLRRLWLNRLYNAFFPSSHVLGSPAFAQFQLIPEYPVASKIVQEWLRDFLFTQDYDPFDLFLSDLTRLGTLAMIFDQPWTLSQSLLHRGTYAYVSNHPSSLNRRGGVGTIVPELLGLIEENPNSNPNYLVAALLALRHIMTEPLHIEIGILCDLIDKLCRSYILAGCFQRDDKLHNVMLPRSWLMKPISIEEQRRKQFSLLSLLLSPVGDLLVQIYSGRFAGHLLYESRNLTTKNIPVRVRTIFISRICRAMCLAGYNIPNEHLRRSILTQLAYLRHAEPEAHFPEAYRYYIEARSWPDLAFAVRRSTRGSSMDEMINILHKDRPQSNRPRGVRSVVYDKIEDLPRLLVGDIPPVVPLSDAPRTILRPPHSTSLPAASSSTSNAPGIPGAQVNPTEIAVVEDNTNDTDTSDSEHEDVIEDIAQQAIPSSISGPLVDQPDIAEPTEEEHQKALIIQQAYRQYISQKTTRRTQIVVLRAQWFTEYLKRDQVQPSRYRKMMLGPLPHTIVFLGLLNMGLLALKNDTRKRTLLPLKAEELDSVDKRMTKIINIVKKIKKWKSMLEPLSDFHSRQDCLELGRLLRDIDDCIRNEVAELPVKISSETRAEFTVGFKGIAQEPVPLKAVPTNTAKPGLNAEDVYEF